MSPNPIDNLPLGTIAAIFDSLATSRWPRQDKPAIASRFGLTLADLQTLIQRRGVESLDPAELRRVRDILLEQERSSILEEHHQAAEQPSEEPAEEPGEGTDPGTRQRLVRLRLDQLRADPNNPREHLEHQIPGEREATDLDQLADSIRENGLLQPIVVRETHLGDQKIYMIVAGHRRAAALRRLHWTTTEVIVRPPMRPDEVLAAMLIENGQRAGLDPIEEARALRTLSVQHGWKDGETARKIGRSQSFVSMRLALLQLDPEEQEKVRAGEMGVVGGAHLGRLKSGRVRASRKNHTTINYYGPTHDLERLARARCNRLGHTGRKITGGVACGACWESVIRADERDSLQTRNATADACVTCGEPIDHNHQALGDGA